MNAFFLKPGIQLSNYGPILVIKTQNQIKLTSTQFYMSTWITMWARNFCHKGYMQLVCACKTPCFAYQQINMISELFTIGSGIGSILGTKLSLPAALKM